MNPGLAVFAVAALLGQADVPDSHDHPAVKRWPSSTISDREYREHETFKFPIKDGATKPVEGKYLLNVYTLPPKITCAESIARFTEQFKASGLSTHSGRAAPAEDVQWAQGRWVSGEGNSESGGQLFVVAGCPTDNFLGAELFLWAIDNEKRQPPIEPSAAAMAEALTARGTLALYGINFAAGKAQVTPGSAWPLEQVAAMLKSKPEWSLRIDVHSDNAGAAKANLALSKKRAEAVKAWLVTKHEIAATRLTTDGLGDKKPVSPNSSELGRANNRRVELTKVEPAPAAP